MFFYKNMITEYVLTNEVRSDALSIKIFYRICTEINKCTINESSGNLSQELKKEILKLAAKYKTKKDKDSFKEYNPVNIKD